jgi:nicotinamidase-related amidase
MLILPAATTALILIDIQKGIVGTPTEPHSIAAVLARGQELARRFRVAGAPVVLVNVAFSPDFGDALKAPVDRPPHTLSGGFPESWAELADGLAEPSDLRITKRQWGAGTRFAAPSARRRDCGHRRHCYEHRRRFDRPGCARAWLCGRVC